MKKLFTAAMAAILSIGIMGSTMNTAEAGKRERRIAAGVALGILGAAIIANEARSERRYYKKRYYKKRYHRGHYRHGHRYRKHYHRPYRARHHRYGKRYYRHHNRGWRHHKRVRWYR